MIVFFISGGLLDCQQVVVFIVLIESGNGIHVIIVCNKITPIFCPNFDLERNQIQNEFL
jgi:hypothetical protein